jgi:hypothetical protein
LLAGPFLGCEKEPFELFSALKVGFGNCVELVLNPISESFCYRLFQGLARVYISTISRHQFQRSLFLKITTLVTWVKSTLLLKIKCFAALLGKESAWEAGLGKEKRVLLIKSLTDAF